LVAFGIAMVGALVIEGVRKLVARRRAPDRAAEDARAH
jgi:hypothetical protein